MFAVAKDARGTTKARNAAVSYLERKRTMESNVLKSVEEISGYTPDEMIAMYDDYERMAKECEACATLKEQTRWVPVSERLPDMCGLKCLVRATNKFEQTEVFTAFTGYMEHGKLEFHSCERPYDDLSVWTITHWMPLPEAPKEEDHADS